MKKTLLMLLLAAAPVMAQRPGQPHPDPFARFFYPPELIMAHAVNINLTDAQREVVRTEVQKAQAKLTDTQFQLAAEGTKLQKLLQVETIDEARVLAEVDAVLGMERELKRAQVSLMVRLRNALTAEQRSKLDTLKMEP